MSKDNYHNLSRKVKLYNYNDLRNKSFEKFGDIEILIKLRDERKNKRENLEKKKIKSREERTNKILSIILKNDDLKDLDNKIILNEFQVICYIENDIKELKKNYSTIDLNSDTFLYNMIKNSCDRIRRREYIKNIYNSRSSNIDRKIINDFITKGDHKDLIIEGKGI